MQYRKQAHAVYYTRYHIVLCARYRRNIFRKSMGTYLMKACRGITRVYPEIAIKEANCDEDHIHLLMVIPPKMAISWVVNVLKSNTARLMRKKYPFLKKLYPRKAGMWSVGYFVSTVGVDEDAIAKYIRYQGNEDQGQAKLEF